MLACLVIPSPAEPRPIAEPVTPAATAVPGSTTGTRQEPTCRPVVGAARLHEPGRVVLVGEIHGTNESPAFVRRLVCLALQSGLAVTLGLEFPGDETPRTQDFLASDGGHEARRTLLAGGRWSAATQYGLTSAAMLDLLEAVRAWRSRGRDVAVELFDRRAGADATPSARDRLMAEALGELAARSPDRLLVALTGNLHSRVVRGTARNPDQEPMGWVLSTIIDDGRIVALDVAHEGGTAWVCLGSGGCGAHPVRARGPAGGGVTDRPAVIWADSPRASGHDGWYLVGALSASPPAGGASTP